MLNKKGEGEFTLYLTIGFLIVLTSAAVAFSDDSSPKGLSLNSGLAGDTLINFESQAQEQRIILQNCLYDADIIASNAYFVFNDCVTDQEILVSEDCPLNINEKYLQELNLNAEQCYLGDLTTSINDEFITLSVNPLKKFKGEQFSIEYDSRVQAKKTPLLSEASITEVLKDLNSRKGCLQTDPNCLAPHTLEGNDLIVQLKMNPYLFVDTDDLVEERTEFTIRVQDFLVTPLFE